MIYLIGIALGFICEKLGKKYGSTGLVRRMPAFLFYVLMPCLLVQIYGLRRMFGDDPTQVDRGERISSGGMIVATIPVLVAFLVAAHSCFMVWRAEVAAEHAEDEAMRRKDQDLPYR